MKPSLSFFRLKAARESARTRNISITWRSISESSNQSLTGLDAEAPSHRSGDPAPDRRLTPVDNRHRADGDDPNHNRPRDLTERGENDNGVVDSDVNGRSNDDVDGHENSFVNGHDNGVINGHNGDVNGHGNGGLNGHGNGNVNSQDNSDVNADDESDSNGDGDVDVTDLGDSVAKFLEIDLNGEFTKVNYKVLYCYGPIYVYTEYEHTVHRHIFEIKH